MTFREEFRQEDQALGPTFHHQLPATPAVVGELVKDRRALLEYVVTLRVLVTDCAHEIPHYSRLHDKIREVMRW